MTVTPTPLSGALVIHPQVYHDTRGYFYELFNKNKFAEHALPAEFVQDNFSKSQKNTLRGLHFQNPPYTQGKLVFAVTGKVLDVIVDIRKNSPTYGKNFTVELSEENKTMLWIPPGFAHGFLTLEDNTIFSYKCTNVYHQPSESGIRWNDPFLGISWKIKNPILSEKDLNQPLWKDFVSLF